MQHAPRWKIGMLVGLVSGVSLGIGSAAAEPPSHPHSLLAWPASPFEVRVAFNQPVDATLLKSVLGRLITFEDEESAIQQGRPDRVEPEATQRGTLRIAAARLVDGGRSLLLVTDPHPRVATYALHLTGIRGPGEPEPEPGAAIDLMYGLGGVAVAWDDGRDGAQPAWSGWWPDLDPGNVRQLTRGSIEHDRALALLSRPGRIVLSTQFVLPNGRHTLRLVSNGKVEAAVIGGENADSSNQPQGGQKVEFPVDSTGEPIDLTVTLRTGLGPKPTTFRASYSKADDLGDVRLDPARLLVPWATTTPPPPADPPTIPQDVALPGGDPARGAAVFFGEQARCSACHAIGGKGGNVGPELGHQFERPPAEVYRDIADPGARINPNYVAYTVALKDGRVLVGIVRAEGADAIRVTDADARTTVVPRAEIEEFRPSPTSIMPVGLAGTLGDGPLRDLLAFLTKPPR